MGIQVILVDRYVCYALENMRSLVKTCGATTKQKEVLQSVIEEAQVYVDQMENALQNEYTPEKLESTLKEFNLEKRSLKQDIRELEQEKTEVELEVKELKLEKREVTFGKKKVRSDSVENINKALESKGRNGNVG